MPQIENVRVPHISSRENNGLKCMPVDNIMPECLPFELVYLDLNSQRLKVTLYDLRNLAVFLILKICENCK